jgi:2-ketoarginine methyltransferase
MKPLHPVITEDRLTHFLQPIRGLVLAQTLFSFLELGIQDALARSPGVAIAELALRLDLHEARVRGLLRFLANEGFVRLENGENCFLTAEGDELARFRPWYKLLVGGYAETFLQLPRALKRDATYATRNASNVGAGSCGISQYDALPMTRRLIEKIGGKWKTVVDIGCGDGSYLIDLCKMLPHARGIGIDPDQGSIDAAILAAQEHGLSERLTLRLGTATQIPALDTNDGPFCFITAFVLQEMLEQSGRDSIITMFRTTFARHPDSQWVVVEVDNRPDDPLLAQGLGQAYYNPYYLIHHLTRQKLERVAFWRELYTEAGLRVTATEFPEKSYDSLGLKIGFLLERM